MQTFVSGVQFPWELINLVIGQVRLTSLAFDSALKNDRRGSVGRKKINLHFKKGILLLSNGPHKK